MKSLIIPAVAAVAFSGYLLARPGASRQAEPAAEAGKATRASEHRVKAHGQLGPGRGLLLVDLKAPKGGKLTKGAPVSVTGAGKDIRVTKVKQKLDPKALPIRIPVDVEDGAVGPVALDVSFYWCKEGSSGDVTACAPEKGRLVVDLDLSGDAAGGEAFLTYEVR
ncbi:MAG: hypothetical protein R3B13_31790 [Polyangiaceae bacterium]